MLAQHRGWSKNEKDKEINDIGPDGSNVKGLVRYPSNPFPDLFIKGYITKKRVMKRTKVTGVSEDARKQREEYKKSGSWLQRNVRYNHGHYLDEKHRRLADRLFISLQLKGGYNIKQKYKDLEILLANLFTQTRRPISISLNRNDYKQTRYSRASYFTVALIYLLLSKKLINMRKGFKIVEGSRMTRIWATEKLLEAFPEYNTGVFWKPVELVELRNERGKLIEYKDTAETWRIRTILQLVNDVNSQADIRYQQYKLRAFLRAIFIERFTWYGRLHTKGFMHYQGFWKEERNEITINGDPIVELDYSGLHPMLLYAAEGKQYLGDPYTVLDRRPEARPFLKQILLCMLNAKDEQTAERAANYWLHKNPEEHESLLKIGIKTARPLIKRFKEVHQPIAGYFCKGRQTGMRIMNQDAKIALDVVNHFAKQGIPILAIHDSFIVQEQYRDELFRVMKTVYEKHTKFRIKVK